MRMNDGGTHTINTAKLCTGGTVGSSNRSTSLHQHIQSVASEVGVVNRAASIEASPGQVLAHTITPFEFVGHGLYRASYEDTPPVQRIWKKQNKSRRCKQKGSCCLLTRLRTRGVKQLSKNKTCAPNQMTTSKKIKQ